MKSKTWNGYSTTVWGYGAVLLDLVQAMKTAAVKFLLEKVRMVPPTQLLPTSIWALSPLPMWWRLAIYEKTWPCNPWLAWVSQGYLTLQCRALVFLGLQTPWFVRYSHFWWMSCGDLYLLGNAQRFSKSGIYVWWLVFQRITGCLCAQTLTRGSRPQSFTCMFYFKIVI